MTKDVLVTIKGLQSLEEEGSPEEVEMVAKGDYYFKNGSHFIFFDEVMEGFQKPTKNSIKISPNCVEVKKKGVTNVQMIFQENKKNLTYYATPFGSLQMGIAAAKIDVQVKEESLDVCIDYALEINEEHAADCQIAVNVRAKDAGDFSLQMTGN